MNTLCLRIPNIDRIGLVLDISKALAARHFNIISMEVELNTIYLETAVQSATDKQSIIASLKAVPQVVDVCEIDLMPHQEKAEQLKAVLASVSEGIVAINPEAKVTQYNPAAEKIIRLPYDAVIGKDLAEISPGLPLMETLHNGTVYNNHEVVLERTKSHYLASGRPIHDHANRIIGAVSVLKDIRDVRELVYTVTGQPTFTFDQILYTSNAMHNIVAMAKAIARGDSTVLIRGETGTGKELFARAIHAASPRAEKMFVPINCAAIPDALLESELFGYEEGAFTGASKGGKQGLFEFANNGTILLDEIGELSAHLQAKLLRVLQDGKVRRIGGNREIPINVRILASTNRNLEEAMNSGTFREDLYYRLNVIPLFLPPLRDRREDIPLLAQFLLNRFATKLQKPISVISDTALQKLVQYNWPGNVRELENVIERAVNIATGQAILGNHVIIGQGLSPWEVHSSTSDKPLAETLAIIEREILVKALTTYRSSREIGKALGLSHTAVLKKLKKFGIPLTN
jgi:transcriptional regulator of aroF, aroG, tyrA and aromatic amino acid transport